MSRRFTTIAVITAGIVGAAVAYTASSADAGPTPPTRPSWVRPDNSIDVTKAHHIPVYNPNGPPTQFIDLGGPPTEVPANP